MNGMNSNGIASDVPGKGIGGGGGGGGSGGGVDEPGNDCKPNGDG